MTATLLSARASTIRSTTDVLPCTSPRRSDIERKDYTDGGRDGRGRGRGRGRFEYCGGGGGGGSRAQVAPLTEAVPPATPTMNGVLLIAM